MTSAVLTNILGVVQRYQAKATIPPVEVRELIGVNGPNEASVLIRVGAQNGVGGELFDLIVRRRR